MLLYAPFADCLVMRDASKKKIRRTFASSQFEKYLKLTSAKVEPKSGCTRTFLPIPLFVEGDSHRGTLVFFFARDLATRGVFDINSRALPPTA